MKHPATMMVTTVNGDTPCCAEHAVKLGGLMRFLGSYADILPLQEPAECMNCVNEAKKREDQP